MPEDTPVNKAELKAALQEHEERLLQRIEKTETNLLTAFRTWPDDPIGARRPPPHW